MSKDESPCRESVMEGRWGLLDVVPAPQVTLAFPYQ